MALGLDVGGTKVSGYLVREDGEVLDRERADTPADDAEEALEAVLSVADALAARGAPLAVGVGAAGMVDTRSGILRYAPNIAWREVPIRERVAGHTGLPVTVDNDGSTAAWGEYRCGAGRGTEHLLMVTVGTGIGGGIIAEGSLLRGAHGFAAEIGHIIVEPGGPRCGCGNLGCWEQVASGSALDRLGREAAAADPGGAIAREAGADDVTGRHVAAAAAAGDAAAAAILADVGRRLGEGIAGLVNVLDPEAVVVGGGVAEIGEPLLGPARVAFLAAVEAPGHRPEVPIREAALGNDAGGIGAALLALEAS